MDIWNIKTENPRRILNIEWELLNEISYFLSCGSPIPCVCHTSCEPLMDRELLLLCFSIRFTQSLIYSNDIMTVVQSPIFYNVFFFKFMCEPHVRTASAQSSGTLHKTEAHTHSNRHVRIHLSVWFAQQHRIQSACLWSMWWCQALVANVVHTNNKDEICIWAFFTIRFRFSNIYPARCSPAFYI